MGSDFQTHNRQRPRRFLGGFIIRWQTLHGKVHLGPPLGLICGTHAALSSLLRVTHAVESSCGRILKWGSAAIP